MNEERFEVLKNFRKDFHKSAIIHGLTVDEVTHFCFAVIKSFIHAHFDKNVDEDKKRLLELYADKYGRDLRSTIDKLWQKQQEAEASKNG